MKKIRSFHFLTNKASFHLVVCFALALVFAGCATSSNAGRNSGMGTKIVLLPANNATNDESAGQAATSMVASSLTNAGWNVTIFTQAKAAADNLGAAVDGTQPAPPASPQSVAREVGAAYLVQPVVHEYRYKTDLNGHPAVGMSLQMVDATTEKILWYGTVGHTGSSFSSVTTVGQHVANLLVRQLPLQMKALSAPSAASSSKR
jgi:hypothetical protein